MWTKDRRWGDQARGCCEDLGKDVGSPHSAITYEGRTGNIRMTLGSQKWEFATMGWKEKGQHKERVPGVWGWVTSVEHRQTTKLEKKKKTKKTPNGSFGPPTGRASTIVISELYCKSQPSLYFNCLLSKSQQVKASWPKKINKAINFQV